MASTSARGRVATVASLVAPPQNIAVRFAVLAVSSIVFGACASPASVVGDAGGAPHDAATSTDAARMDASIADDSGLQRDDGVDWGVRDSALGADLGGSVSCGSLFAARLAADHDLPDCDTALLGSEATSACVGLTADACAEHFFENPRTGAANGAHDLFLVQLPRCSDGSDSCVDVERVRCADGTRGFFYVDKAIDAMGRDIESDRWLFFGDAGGPNCDSDATCSGLYAALGRGGMSSHDAARSYSGTGVLEAAPGANPFHGYNRVFVERCTSDSLAGRGAPITSVRGPRFTYAAPIFHHGARGYEAAFRALSRDGGLPHTENGEAKRLPDFRGATHVVLIGFSGSSRGLAHNGDGFADVIAGLTSGRARTTLAFDAAFSPSLENELHWDETGATLSGNDLYSRVGGIPTESAPHQMEPDEDGPGEERVSSAGFELGGATREGLLWWGAEPDTSCVSTHGAAWRWECAEREHVMANHLRSHTFIAHRLFDASETGSPMGVPVHGWMHSRAACTAMRSLANCYNWHDDDYRDRSRFQLETMMSRHADAGEEAPYGASFAAFATAKTAHEGLISGAQMVQSLGRCEGGAFDSVASVRLVDALRLFVEGALPNYWSAIEGLPHPDGGVWSSPGNCR